MIPEELKKMDDILSLIRTDRYSIERAADIQPVIKKLSEIHRLYQEDLENITAKYLQLPHSRELMEEVTIRKKAEWEYLRGKAEELMHELEDDDLSTMAQEVLNFMTSLQVYLNTASGRFIDYHGQPEDILEHVSASAFLLPENYTAKFKSVSMQYETRTETGELVKDDLGYKLYTLLLQLQQDWIGVSSACEKLQFIAK